MPDSPVPPEMKAEGLSFVNLHPVAPLPVLMRATNGKSKEDVEDKIKISTAVQPDTLEAFYVRYAKVYKTRMSRLRKCNRIERLEHSNY